MATESNWRMISRHTIAEALSKIPPDANDRAKRLALRNAYPFGLREHHPYRIWCSEVNRTLGGRKKKEMGLSEPAFVFSDSVVKPKFWIWVACPWCSQVNGSLATIRELCRGCLQCGPWFRRIGEVFECDTFAGLMRSLRYGDQTNLGVIADWLEENEGEPHGLSLLFRTEYEKVFRLQPSHA